MYCKFHFLFYLDTIILRINSSKVYCKFFNVSLMIFSYFVLIVAKCIVNVDMLKGAIELSNVLIVAKCIVNI